MITNPVEVQGAWRRGWTLDVHTTSSEFLGYDEHGHAQFDTIRSALGELVYQLKYREQTQAAPQIAAAMAEFIHSQSLLARIDLIIPMPPSTVRAVQPVDQIAKELGKALSIPVVAEAVRKTRETPGLKDIRDQEKRRELLDCAFEINGAQVAGKGLLLVDDLYRSGATANAVVIALMRANASRVYLLAATRTRSNL